MPPAQTRRARTEAQKFQRRQDILAAADRHFREVGFEAFSMAKLAKLAGVAKGTLYLYFGTREEVLLALHADQLERWSDALAERLFPGMTDEGFIDAFEETARHDDLFLPLALRLDHVIEHNVSMDALIASKRSVRAIVEQTADRIAQALRLEAGDGIDLIRSLGSLLIGASRVDQGPSLDEEDLPEDVRRFIEAFDSSATFQSNARRIIAGIRAGT